MSVGSLSVVQFGDLCNQFGPGMVEGELKHFAAYGAALGDHFGVRGGKYKNLTLQQVADTLAFRPVRHLAERVGCAVEDGGVFMEMATELLGIWGVSVAEFDVRDGARDGASATMEDVVAACRTVLRAPEEAFDIQPVTQFALLLSGLLLAVVEGADPDVPAPEPGESAALWLGRAREASPDFRRAMAALGERVRLPVDQPTEALIGVVLRMAGLANAATEPLPDLTWSQFHLRAMQVADRAQDAAASTDPGIAVVLAVAYGPERPPKACQCLKCVVEDSDDPRVVEARGRVGASTLADSAVRALIRLED